MKGKWNISPLGLLTEIKKGEQLNSEKLLPQGKYPVINGGVEPSGFWDECNESSKTITISEGGNSCGYVSWQNIPYWAGGHCYSLLKIQITNPKFLFFQLKFHESAIMKLRVGSGLPNIQRKDLELVDIYFPENTECQQLIADILTSCDEVIEQTEKAIAKYQAIKTGMVHELFTRGVDADGKLRPRPEDAPELYKDSPLGKIPKEWEINSIGNLFDLEVGGDLNKNYFSCFKTAIHKYPIFSNSLENSGLYGYTSFPNYPAESITLTGRGSLGHAEYRTTPFDAIIRLVVLKTKKKNAINCKFVTEQLNYDKDFFIESTGVPQLTAPQTAKMRIRIPFRYSEQQTIASHLFAIDEKIAIEKQTLQKYIAIKQGLMKKLLTPPEGALEYEKAQ